MNSFLKVIILLTIALYFKEFKCKSLIFPHSSFAEEASKIKSDQTFLESFKFDILSINLRDKEKSTSFEKITLKVEQAEFNNTLNNLLVLDLRKIERLSLNNLIKVCNFQIIFCESINQILDFFKKFKEIKIQIIRIILLRNEQFGLNEYLFFIKKDI